MSISCANSSDKNSVSILPMIIHVLIMGLTHWLRENFNEIFDK